MKREDLGELHYITPIANLDSILKHGILSHNQAKRISHMSVAMQEIQDRRKNIVIPAGKPLHDYVNLYICARNPMLYKRRLHHAGICVLRISTEVLDIPATVITDQNASSKYVRFGSAPEGLRIVNQSMVFADDWTNPYDQIAEWRHKCIKCAEVLVPDHISQTYILGAYVSCSDSSKKIQVIAPQFSVTIDSHLFFK